MKDKGQRCLVEALNKYENQEEETMIKPFFLENDSEKILKQSQPAVE